MFFLDLLKQVTIDQWNVVPRLYTLFNGTAHVLNKKLWFKTRTRKQMDDTLLEGGLTASINQAVSQIEWA